MTRKNMDDENTHGYCSPAIDANADNNIKVWRYPTWAFLNWKTLTVSWNRHIHSDQFCITDLPQYWYIVVLDPHPCRCLLWLVHRLHFRSQLALYHAFLDLARHFLVLVRQTPFRFPVGPIPGISWPCKTLSCPCKTNLRICTNSNKLHSSRNSNTDYAPVMTAIQLLI